MKEDSDLNLSSSALHKVLLLPVGVMIVTLHIVFSISWYFDKGSKEDELNNQVAKVLEGHLPFLSQEIFLDRQEAVKERLHEIANAGTWNLDKLKADLCLYLVFEVGFNKRSPEVYCTDKQAQFESRDFYKLLYVPVNITNKTVAKIFYEVRLHSGFFEAFPPSLLWPMTISIMASFFAYLLLFRRVNINLIQPAHHRIVQNEKLAAVAKFVQIVAHDLRRPFNLLRMTIEGLSHEEIQRHTKKRLMETVEQEFKHVDNMLCDVMVGEPPRPAMKAFCPNELIRGALKRSEHLYRRKNIEIVYNLSKEAYVYAEKEKVYRVLTNIIENAVAAVQQNGKIWIKTRLLSATASSVEFCIGNSGSYITAEDISKIFEPFFTKGKVDGTGLGLASAKAIIEAHEGKIWCRSDKQIGTEFYFTLPMRELSCGEEASDLSFFTKVSSYKSGKKIVAFIDDDLIVYQYWVKHFPDIDICYFGCPSQFWQYCESSPAFLHEIDAVVTDFRFADESEENGNHVALRIKKLVDTPIYLLTNYTLEELRDILDESLFAGVLSKGENPIKYQIF